MFHIKINLRSTRLLVGAVVILLSLLTYSSITLYNMLYQTDVLQDLRTYASVQLRLLFNKPFCPGCNVILVSLDTLGANHLPCYGYGRNTAPNLCQFGEQNVFFKNAYANSYFTLPNHVSIFTGLLPSKHKVNETDKDILDPTIPLLPEILKENGYKTYFNISPYSQNLSLTKVYNRGIDQVIDESPGSLDSWKQALDIFKQNHDKNEKTFLFLHSYFVHSPYLVQGKKIYTDKSFVNIPSNAAEYYKCDNTFLTNAKKILETGITDNAWLGETPKYRQLYDSLRTATDEAKICQDKKNELLFNDLRQLYFYSHFNITTMEMANYMKDLYDQRINELDESIQMLLAFIKQDDIKNDTILIFTADHGEEFMEHQETLHTTLYDSNVKVPLMMYIPGVGNKKISTNAQSTDLTPTILDFLRIKFSYPFQGESLVRDIANSTNRNRYVVAERIYDGLKTIRDNTYKLFLKTDNNVLVPYELYNIEDDPGEKKNIIFQHPDVTERLKNQIMKQLSR